MLSFRVCHPLCPSLSLDAPYYPSMFRCRPQNQKIRSPLCVLCKSRDDCKPLSLISDHGLRLAIYEIIYYLLGYYSFLFCYFIKLMFPILPSLLFQRLSPFWVWPGGGGRRGVLIDFTHHPFG